MDPASKIIERLGGEAKVAEITSTALTAPYRWQYSREKGGTGGQIPQKYWRALIGYARRHDISLSVEEFISAEDAA